MRPRHYQAFMGGATVALGLWFLASWLRMIHAKLNNDLGVGIFNGRPPPIPQYRLDDTALELHDIDGKKPDPAYEEASADMPADTTAAGWNPAWDDEEWSKPGATPMDPISSLPTTHISHEKVDEYVHSILNFNDDSTFERVSCPSEIGSRYSQLRTAGGSEQVRYFFALDLYQSAEVISRLMSSIVEAMRFLGPEHCAISVTEGRSEDGTYEILAALKSRVEAMSAHFFLSTSEINPLDGERSRIEALSDLRNMALGPLKAKGVMGPMDALAGMYSPDTVIIFINDIALCPEDILELIFQHVNQGANMTCAFDWIFNGTLFYDVWVSRSLVGDTFFEIPHDASWAYSKDLFWNDPDGRRRYEAYQPLQVYSCWGGMVTLDAASFAEDILQFRGSEPGECFMGEPTLLAKDLYRHGHGKILAVPAVNVAYSDKEAVGTKSMRGYVSDHVNVSKSMLDQEESVTWQSKPPGMVKCLPNFDQPTWTEPT